jgi:2-dehydro-3-deoxy-D-arabinonate dehydratase
MKLYNTAGAIFLESNKEFYKLKDNDWDELVNRSDLTDYLEQQTIQPPSNKPENLLAPIGTQEIWAAGVTYFRSKEARMEESKESGAAVFYSKVYDAERPELFFKSTHYRVAHPDHTVNIRKDSKWNVPEPELTLFINNEGKIAGYTIGNDMSSRDIEGENPLYLPQAKCYDKSAAIGPCLWISQNPINPEAEIQMTIERVGSPVFSGKISINQMKRKHEELSHYLQREMSFPKGVYLMTGTCLVPDDTFSLLPGDKICITIAEIGTLVNYVA